MRPRSSRVALPMKQVVEQVRPGSLPVRLPRERREEPIEDPRSEIRNATSYTVFGRCFGGPVLLDRKPDNQHLGAQLSTVFEIEQERAAERAQAALAVLEARNAGITYSVQAFTSTPFEAAESVSAFGATTNRIRRST